MADQGTGGQRPAGWKKDPSGRHFGRFWDGSQWTEHVISAEKVQSVDPMPPPPEPSIFGDSPPPPAPPPRPAPAPPATPAPTFRGPVPTAPGWTPEAKRSKDGGVKVWKIALGVMLGLFLFMGVCAVVISAGADKAAKDIKAAGTSPATSSASTPTTMGGARPDNAPSATRASTATTAGVTEVALGSKLTITPGDHKVTAYAYKAPIRSTNQFNAPKDGNQFAAIDVEYCAGSGGDRFGPNSFDFQLSMPDNTRIRPANSAGLQQPTFQSTPLQAGECVRGWVNFEVPTDPAPRFINYTSGTAAARWRIA